MIVTKKRVLLVISLVGIGIAAFIARDWYNRRYVWPIEIQQALLGGLLAPSSALIQQEGYSHFGQGMYRWRYRVDPKTELLRSLCGPQRIDTCVFTKSRMVSSNVGQIVGYQTSVLTVEEDWY